jgi:hypothetical protein
MWFQTIAYRLWQVRQQIGSSTPLSPEEDVEVASWLPPSAFTLFKTMSPADQQHSLRVCRGLQHNDCQDPDMLAAALLHDVGKAQGRVPFWTRPAIVLGKAFAPAHLKRLAVAPSALPSQGAPRWRRSLSYAWWHAEVGAELATAAGLSEQAVLYIRTHHQPNGPAAALHAVDEVS